MSTYRITSPLSMAGAALAGLLSTALLIEPMIAHGFTPAQVIAAALAIGLVLLTIATGVLAHGHGLLTVTGAVFAALSLLGSGLIIWEQGGRRAQVRGGAALVQADTGKERQRLVQLRAEAEEILAVHRKSLARECASGNGVKCGGASYTVRTWEAAVKGYDAQLKTVPTIAPDGKSETATAFAGLLGYDTARVRQWVAHVDPFAMPAWLELVTIVCAIAAISRRKEDAEDEGAEDGAEETADVPALAAPTPVSRLAAPAHPLPLVVASDEERVVAALEKRGGSVPSQQDLGIALGYISPGEVSKMLRNCSPDRIERIKVDNKNIIRLKDMAAA